MMVDMMSSEESDPEDENSMLVRSLPWRASLVDEFYDSRFSDEIRSIISVGLSV